jgi:Ca2+-binding RTX toxin-like protein
VPAGFTVTEGLSASLAPGASDTFTVRANATAVGTFTGNLTFNNNDSNESPYNFTIKAVVNPATFSLAGGVLTVTGTSGNDYIRGSVASNVLTMKMNALSQTFANASAITRIVVNALAGNDLILLAQSVNRPTSLNGGDGNDTFYGGSGADVINGGNNTDSAVKGSNDSLTLVEEILA